jgi:hypothetical protein
MGLKGYYLYFWRTEDMKRIVETMLGTLGGGLILCLGVFIGDKFDENQKDIKRLKKRLDKIDRQLACLEVVEDEEVDD